MTFVEELLKAWEEFEAELQDQKWALGFGKRSDDVIYLDELSLILVRFYGRATSQVEAEERGGVEEMTSATFGIILAGCSISYIIGWIAGYYYAKRQRDQ